MKGITLRTARKRAHLTQQGLAAKSKVTQGTISKLERKGGRPAFDTVTKLADALNLDPHRLVFGRDAVSA